MDLISRQEAIDALDETDWYHQNRNGEMVHGANSAEHQPWYKSDDVYKALESVPSTDAVEVVRCKDCNHYSSRESVCKLHSNNYEPCVYMNDDDFCSRGERKDD